MASQAPNHTRSQSFPSQSNPAFSRFRRALSDARDPVAPPTKAMAGLQHLYSTIDDILRLPHVHQLIPRESHGEWAADLVLDGHIALFDAWTLAKDHVSLAKQSVQDLLSALRRKDVVGGIHRYVSSRRKSRKAIRKALRESKIFEGAAQPRVVGSDETVDLACVLGEAEVVAVEMIESLLWYLMGMTKVEARQSRWALVYSKLVTGPKKIASSCENEFGKVDRLLQSNLDGAGADDITRHLKRMEFGIGNLEDELDCLFRQLIKTRVSLLNLLNH